nr:hypothetical protein CFP56_12133 [Quercus suber]
MLRSHRPRGYFWTAASEFQESKQFRQIDYEDCTAPVATILADDTHDQLPISQRAAKRRRIEGIAHDFMIGEPIRLETTAFRPHRIRTFMERNRWTSTRRSSTLTGYHEDESSNDLWVDLDPEFSGTHCGPISEKPEDAIQRHKRTKTLSDDPADIGTEASGPFVLQFKSPPASISGPITNSLQAAAVLRARPQSRSECKSRSRKLQTNVRARASSHLVSQTRQTNVSVSVNRRKMMRNPNDENSGDEVRMSRLDTLSKLHAITFAHHHTAVSTDAERTLHDSVSGLSSGIDHGSISCLASSAALTERIQEREGIPIVLFTGRRTECSSYDNLCRRRRHSAPDGLPQDSRQLLNVTPITPHRASLLQPVAEVTEYIAAPAPSDGSTPFMYRKRSRKLKRSSESANFTGMPGVLPGMQQSLLSESDDKITRTIDVANVHFNVPEISLIDTHINTEFTATADSAGARSQLRKALQRELRNSGATITNADGNVPPSSPDSIQSKHSQCHAIVQREQTPDDLRQSVWLGTQKIIQQVERELFTSRPSPHDDKESSTGADQHTGLLDRAEAREPLRELSQAPEESIGTQTLIETWSPWSTIKKPRSGIMVQATAISPCLDARDTAPRAHEITAEEHSPVAQKSLIPSTSYYSGHSDSLTVNSTKSTLSTARLGDPSSKQPSSGIGDRKGLTTKSNMTGLSRANHPLSPTITLHNYIAINKNVRHIQSEHKTLTTPVSTEQSLSSYEATRRLDSESQLSGIINDLTTSLLRTDDMEGLLGEL